MTNYLTEHNFLTNEEFDIIFSPNVEERRKSTETDNLNILRYLAYDKDWIVRLMLADKGIPELLDILVNDDDWMVKCSVAKNGISRHLDILSKDKDPYVRNVVARFGDKACLESLINDNDKTVRETAIRRLSSFM